MLDTPTCGIPEHPTGEFFRAAGGGASEVEDAAKPPRTFPNKSDISDGLTGLRRGFQRSVMETLEEYVRSRISAFLEDTGMGPTTFGLKAVGDRNLISQMEGGRSLTLRMADRVLAFIADHERGSGGARDPPLRPRYRKPSRERRRTKNSTGTPDQPRNERTRAPTRILRLPEVMARTGLSRTTIYEWRVAERFPQAVRLGTRNVGFIESELEAWFRERMADRPGRRGDRRLLTPSERKRKKR